jgi:hypothetical protein
MKTVEYNHPMEITKINTDSFNDILLTRPRFTGCVEDTDGDRCWLKDGLKHREDGPATEYKKSGGRGGYYREGDRYHKAQWQQAVLNYKIRRILNSPDSS